MKRTKQNVNQIHWGYWSNFFGNFLFGICLVFAFSILVSLTDTKAPDAGILLFEGIKRSYYLVPQYLSLTIAGALGGLLYSILLDGGLEMPGWGKHGKSLKTGSIGEVFVGIGGAFTTYIFIPDALKQGSDSEIITFVFGLVGGYGGKAILNAALEKIKGRIGEADLVAEEKERLAQEVDQLNEEQNLIKLVTRQIDQGLPPSEIYGLSGQIQNASEELQQQVFTMAKEIRHLSWRSKAAKAELMRTIPIFQALVNSDPKNDHYHAQLGYAYKDCDPPRLEDSISQINQAIQLRGSHIVGSTWKYELNRALSRIMAEAEQTLENGTASTWREEILAGLFTVDRNYGLAKVLLESEDEVVDIPLKRWLEKNQDWIKERSGGKSLLLKAFKVSQTPQSLNTREPLALAATSSSIGRLGLRRGVDSLKENATSGSLSTRSLRNRRSLRLNTVINTDHLETAPPNTKIKATTKTYLKKQLIESSELLDNEKLPVLVGKEYKVLKYSEETNGHYLVELDYGAGIWYLYSDHWQLPWKEDQQTETVTYPVFFTKDNLKKIMPHASSEKIDAYLEPINRVCHEFEINTAKRAAAYIAQVAHESCSLLYEEEIADGSAYEGRRDLGNTQRGDGKRYKGRGLIQVTGRYNYRDCGKALGLPLEEKPELLLKDPYTNALSTGWYWKSRNINAAADAGDFRKVTKLINGGTNGYADRCQFWERAKKYIPSNPISQTITKADSGQLKEKGAALKHTNPAVQRQIDRLTKYLPTGKTLNLDVTTKYFNQRDNYTDPHGTCNSSSNAMYLDWLLCVTGRDGLGGDDEYLKKVLKKGKSIVHDVQTRVIKDYGFSTKWMMDRDLPFLKDLVKAGFPVVVNISHRGTIEAPRKGHVIMLISHNNGYWIAHDPYGTLASKYRDTNGAYSQISDREFKARWQGGYRTLA